MDESYLWEPHHELQQQYGSIVFDGCELEQFLLDSLHHPQCAASNKSGASSTEVGDWNIDFTFISELMECEFEAGLEEEEEEEEEEEVNVSAPSFDRDLSTSLADHSNYLRTDDISQESVDVMVKFPPRSAVATAAMEEGTVISGVTSEESKDEIKQEKMEDEEKQLVSMKLLHLMLACAEAISEKNTELAEVILLRVEDLASENGTPLQRLAVYMSEALLARLNPTAKMAFSKKLKEPVSQADLLEAFCLFYNVNPIGKFCHLTMNQMIVDSLARWGNPTVLHIVDLHIGYGMQWAAFLQALALWPQGKPHVRLTAVGLALDALVNTGNKLSEMASSLHVSFEYHPAPLQLLSLTSDNMAHLLALQEGEARVITSLGQLHTLLHQGDDYLITFLEAIRTAARPHLFLFAENDVDHNSDDFLCQFVECLKYYAAVFDSLAQAHANGGSGSRTIAKNEAARCKVERLLAGRKIGSIISDLHMQERHERMVQWMRRMQRAGFTQATLSDASVKQAHLLLNLYYPNGYSLTLDYGALTLGWQGTPLIALAGWH